MRRNTGVSGNPPERVLESLHGIKSVPPMYGPVCFNTDFNIGRDLSPEIMAIDRLLPVGQKWAETTGSHTVGNIRWCTLIMRLVN
jgi:hypothetical protein